MHFSIVTPTIARQSLILLCQTLDVQTYQDYEHLIVVDIPFGELTEEQKTILHKAMNNNERRQLYFCEKRHRNTGNSCRRSVAPLMKGEYAFYIDDDDYFAGPDVLETLSKIKEDWAIFPVMLQGRRIYSDPPQLCNISTGGFMHRKGLAVWPDGDVYEADWAIVTQLLGKYNYKALPEFVTVIHPVDHFGRP